MPCVHKDLDHDTAAEVFAADWVGNWHQLLDLPALAFWFILALRLSMKACGPPVIGMAFAAALVWSYRSTLRYAIWVICMLGIWADEVKYRDCLYSASYGEPQLGYGATIRYRLAEPQDRMAGTKPAKTTVWIPAPLCLISANQPYITSHHHIGLVTNTSNRRLTPGLRLVAALASTPLRVPFRSSAPPPLHHP